MKPLPASPADDELPASVVSSSRAWLSALADGEAQAAQPACEAWRDDEDARLAWHSYQLIGDVMRSEDLASRPARDAAFLAGVRARLAAEPVVLAPEPVPVPATRRQPWLVPVAAAAGFAVVAGVLVVARMSQPGADVQGPVLANASAPQGGTRLVGAAVPQQRAPGGDPRYIHDPRVDEYLRVHQATRGGLAPAANLRPTQVAVPVSAER